MVRTVHVWTTVLLVSAGGCAADTRGRGTDTGNDNPPASQGPSPSNDGGTDMSTNVTPTSTEACGVQNFMLQKGLPPEVMIVLDRSDSMTTAFDNGTRWSAVSDAVDKVVTGLQGQIGWGLTVFPSDDDCGTSANVSVPVTDNNASTISAQIASFQPGGNTPTADAIKKAAAYMAARTTPNPKYLLLSTDGEPNCGTLTTQCVCLIGTLNAQNECCVGSDCGACTMIPSDTGTSDAEAALKAAAAQGIHTFVVGVASDSDDSDELDIMATDGAEPRTSEPKFYAVGSEADLVTAVNTIATQIISCSFGLTTAPPNPTLTTVSVDGTKLPQDTTHMNGWDYGANDMSIVFYGAACQTLQNDPNAKVQAVYGCPPVS